MKAAQLIGYTLAQTTAITAIVGASTASRIYHGLRPASSQTPCINYYERSTDTRWGIAKTKFSINCRATTASGARALSGLVSVLFGGTTGDGIYGTQNGFDVGRAYVVSDLGLIPEPADGIFNSPIEVQVSYRVETET